MFLNVTAGIGVLGQASPMIQEVFDSFSVSAERAYGVTMYVMGSG